jgi:hypothetical protein
MLEAVTSCVLLIFHLLLKLVLLWRLCKAISLMNMTMSLPTCAHNSLSLLAGGQLVGLVLETKFLGWS